MRARTKEQREAELRAVCQRAQQGCYFERLGVRIIEARVDIDAALNRALELGVDPATDRSLREAHATLIDPAARSIYLIVRNRLAAYGLLPPLRQPRRMEVMRYVCSCVWRRLRGRFRAKQTGSRAAPGLPTAFPNPLRTTWAKPHRKPSR